MSRVFVQQNHLDRPLNILTCPTHERYESGLAETEHNFYAMRANGIKDWNLKYAKLPDNYTLLGHGENPPSDVEFDLVISQNKFGQFQLLSQWAQRLGIPLISHEHTLPVPNWPPQQLKQLKQMAGHTNTFISEYSRKMWGWGTEAQVIHHGVHPQFENRNLERKRVILSVVNDWKNRQWCCNYTGWVESTRGLPVFPVGDTPGLSKPAKDTEELIEFYNTHEIFINTSTISPVPSALLEAMSCGCACVSLATCMIPEIIKHGENGYLANSNEELRYYLEKCLENPELCRRLGNAARQTILDKFSLDKFVQNWNNILYGTLRNFR